MEEYYDYHWVKIRESYFNEVRKFGQTMTLGTGQSVYFYRGFFYYGDDARLYEISKELLLKNHPELQEVFYDMEASHPNYKLTHRMNTNGAAWRENGDLIIREDCRYETLNEVTYGEKDYYLVLERGPFKGRSALYLAIKNNDNK